MASPGRSAEIEKGQHPEDAALLLVSNSDSRLVAIVAALTAKTTTAAAFAAATAAAAESTVFFRTGFVDIQRTAVKLPAVQLGNRPVAFGIICHFDEPETAGLSGVPVGHHTHAINGTVRFKHGANRIFGSTKAEISYKNVFHFNFFLQLQNSESRAGSDMGGGPDNVKDACISELTNYALL